MKRTNLYIHTWGLRIPVSLLNLKDPPEKQCFLAIFELVPGLKVFPLFLSSP
jgi:hypothetical protein